MKGSIRCRGNKTWQIQVYLDVGTGVKNKRYFETIHGHKKDAQRRLNELLVSLDKGVFVPPGKMTMSELFDKWLSGYVITNCSQRTLEGYKSIIDKHLSPYFGSLPLKKMSAQIIQSYYGQACLNLSKRTVHHQHTVLSAVLKYALRQGYLGINPCTLVDPPKPVKKPMRTLNPMEVELLFKEIKDSYYYPIIYTAVSSGLRQAELLGLRWRDVDLGTCSISVNQVLYKRSGVCTFKEPKTTHSRRCVCMTAKLADFLKEYKVERGLLYIASGKTLTLDSLVFTSYSGQPLNPSVLNHNFHKLATKAGLPGVRFHDLRHTFASLMLLRGAKPKVISEALGHSSVAFTMDVYSHIIEGMQSEAMALLDEILPAGVCSNNVKLTASP